MNRSILTRRQFVLSSAGLAATALLTGCDEKERNFAAKGAAAGAAGIGLAVALGVLAGPGVVLVGAVLTATAAGLELYALLKPSGTAAEPTYREFDGLTTREDSAIPRGQVRVRDSHTGRDITPSVFIDDAARRRLGGGSLSASMTGVRYRCPRRVLSLPFSSADILTLKYRAQMFGVPCDARPTPVGGGRYTIAYGGIEWQTREFADRQQAQAWYSVFAAAPGFEVELT